MADEPEPTPSAAATAATEVPLSNAASGANMRRTLRSFAAEPEAKNNERDFFICILIILGVGAICAGIMVALHFGVLTKDNKFLGAKIYPKLKYPPTTNETTTKPPAGITPTRPLATARNVTSITTTNGNPTTNAPTTPSPAP